MGGIVHLNSYISVLDLCNDYRTIDS